MKKINYIFVLLFLFTSLSFAQLTVKDQESSPNTLLQVVDEGTSGSVILPPLSAITDPAGKLYNLGSVLYWGSTALGSSGSAGGWTNATGKVYNTTLADKVGIGTSNPLSVLHLRTQDNWSPAVGDGWGDFSISDGTKGLAIGMAVGGGGAGDIRIWAKGGTERIMIGDATNGDVLTTVDGKVGVGVSSPTEKLEVAGQVKITGGSPGDGKVLTSDADGLATWEEKKIGFYATLNSDITPASFTDTQLQSFTETFDDGTGFNTTTGVYTIPTDGVYQFILKVQWRASSTLNNVPTILRLRKNGATFQQFTGKVDITTSYGEDKLVTGIVVAEQGDQITFTSLYSSSTPLTIEAGSGSGSARTNVAGFKIY